MQKFIRKPDIDLYPGITVQADTRFEFSNDHVEQRLENLVFTSVTRIMGEGYQSIYNTTIQLKEGDVLIFDGEGRGYIKPVEQFVTAADAIAELECIREE